MGWPGLKLLIIALCLGSQLLVSGSPVIKEDKKELLDNCSEGANNEATKGDSDESVEDAVNEAEEENSTSIEDIDNGTAKVNATLMPEDKTHTDKLPSISLENNADFVVNTNAPSITNCAALYQGRTTQTLSFSIGSQNFKAFIGSPQTWLQAVDTCKRDGLQLAEPINPSALAELLSKHDYEHMWWIGAKSVGNGRNFKWLNGSLLDRDQSDWMDKNFHDVDMCVGFFSLWSTISTPFNDKNCNIAMDYICQELCKKPVTGEHADHYSALEKLITSGNNIDIKEVSKALVKNTGATSSWSSNLGPIKAFTEEGYLHNGDDTSQTQTIWFKFSQPIIITKYSFFANNSKNLQIQKQLFGSNSDCSDSSSWINLKDERSDSSLDSLIVENVVNELPFICYGFKFIKSKAGLYAPLKNLKFFGIYIDDLNKSLLSGEGTVDNSSLENPLSGNDKTDFQKMTLNGNQIELNSGLDQLGPSGDKTDLNKYLLSGEGTVDNSSLENLLSGNDKTDFQKMTLNGNQIELNSGLDQLGPSGDKTDLNKYLLSGEGTVDNSSLENLLSGNDKTESVEAEISSATTFSQESASNTTYDIFTVGGSKCIFPFMFYDIEYNACSPGTSQPHPWCATTINDNKTWKTWDVCASPVKQIHQNLVDDSGATSSYGVIWGPSWDTMKAFSEASYWLSGENASLPQSIWFKFSQPIIIKKYSFSAKNLFYIPTQYGFFGSNSDNCSDSSTWVTLFMDIEKTFADPTVENVDNDLPYTCYGFTILKSNGAIYASMKKLKFFGVVTDESVEAEISSATTISQESASNTTYKVINVGTHTFMLFNDGWGSWSEARFFCMENGFDLAEPEDPQALAEFLVEQGDHQTYWIGGRSNTVDFKWPSGRITDRKGLHLVGKEYKDGPAYCVDLLAFPALTDEPLNDWKCSDQMKFICDG